MDVDEQQSDIRVRHHPDGSARRRARGRARPGALLSGVPSTAVTLLRRESLLDGATAAGSILLPAERRTCRSSPPPSPCTSRCRSGGRRSCAPLLPRRATVPAAVAGGLRDRGVRPRGDRPRVPRDPRAPAGPPVGRPRRLRPDGRARRAPPAAQPPAAGAAPDRVRDASGASSGTKCPTPSSRPELDVGEELVEPVGPCAREQRVVLRPQHASSARRCGRAAPAAARRAIARRHRRPRGTSDARGEGARAARSAATSASRRVGLGRRSRARPVLPEVLEVGADGARVAVDQPLGERRAGGTAGTRTRAARRAQDPLADARQRRRDDERAHVVRQPRARSPARRGCRRRSRRAPGARARAPRSAPQTLSAWASAE